MGVHHEFILRIMVDFY